MAPQLGVDAQLMQPRASCFDLVLERFPDIDPQVLGQLVERFEQDSFAVVSHLLDECQRGRTYAKVQRRQAKRKREDPPETKEQLYELQRQKYRKKKRLMSDPYFSKILLSQAFPFVPLRTLVKVLAEHGNLLYQSYLAVGDALRNHAHEDRWKLKKTRSTRIPEYVPELLDHAIETAAEGGWAKRGLLEYRLARIDDLNIQEATKNGLTADCDCCYVEHPINRMAQCLSGDHHFCHDCMQKQAETLVSLARFDLVCFASDECQAAFARREVHACIDQDVQHSLEMIEATTVVGMAKLPDLASCPFCDFAAEYPSVAVDKEFRCLNPTCLKVSCRLCRSITHIPQSCEEVKREVAAQRGIEEAMSNALIRRCNKCKMPFIKLDGCNKMRCPKQGCGNFQCYICSANCTYQHFHNEHGQAERGKCPLYDNVEARHVAEVQAAEQKARQNVEQGRYGVPGVHLHANVQ